MTSVNLLPASIKHARRFARRVRGWTVAIAAGALCVSLATGAVALWSPAHTPLAQDLALSTRLTSLETQLTQVSREAARVQRTVSELRLAPVPDWSLVLRALAESRRDEVVLQFVEIEAREQDATIVIAGAGVSARAVDSFVTTLESLNVFDEVNQLENRAGAIGDLPACTFRLRCVITTARHAGATTEVRDAVR